MEALPAEPVSLAPVSCAVGDVVTIPVTIENPTAQVGSFTSRIDNKRNFSIEPAKVRGMECVTAVMPRRGKAQLHGREACLKERRAGTHTAY